MNAELAEARKEVAERLRSRQEEIERAVATRVYAISALSETADPNYLDGLRVSLTVALEYAFAAVELGERRAPSVPPLLLAQARMAARNGVGLNTVLRRYLAGYSLLVEFILDEAAAYPPNVSATLRQVLYGQAAVFDRLLEGVSDEYEREAARLPRSGHQRLADRVRRLLAGESIETADLEYELDAVHVALLASGGGAKEAVQALASKVGVRHLSVPVEEGCVWAWLSSSRELGPRQLSRIVGLARDGFPSDIVAAFGEPGEGLHGWRLSYRQAATALPMARRDGDNVVRYADVGLLASIENDETLVHSLRELYLERLSAERDGGEGLRETLRVYLSCGRNTTSTAAALGVNRETVRNRLRVAEDRLGRSLDDCAAELEIALRLAQGQEQASVPPPVFVAHPSN